MGKCRCTQYKSLQIVMNGDHALVHKDRKKGFENGGKEAAAQDASRSWKSQRCKSSGGIFLPKKEKISGAVRGRKDKRLQILAVRGGNLCWKTWEMFRDKVQQLWRWVCLCTDCSRGNAWVETLVCTQMMKVFSGWLHVQLALKLWHMTEFCFQSFWDNSLLLKVLLINCCRFLSVLACLS